MASSADALKEAISPGRKLPSGVPLVVIPEEVIQQAILVIEALERRCQLLAELPPAQAQPGVRKRP